MNTTKPHITLPAEWAEQDAVLIAWPHPDTDWNYMLDEVEACYMSVAEAISNHEPLIIARAAFFAVSMEWSILLLLRNPTS